MKTLYLECNMGAAGDMLMGALLELVPDREAFLRRINGLNLPGVEVSAEQAEKCGITGTHMKVIVHGEEEESLDEAGAHDPEEHGHHHHDHEEDEHHHHHDEDDDHGHHHHHHDEDDDHGHHHHHHDDEHDHEHHHHDHEEDEHHHHHHDHEDEHHHHDHDHGHHHHASAGDIAALIDSLPVSEKVKRDARAVYDLIAAAESQVHGRPVTDIHFHEVGTMDAVADVVGVCMLMEEIGADRIVASPVHVGSGFVRCMHGVLPVPAPATALILQGIPTYGGQVKGELCTPTGAALLKHFASSFGDRPLMAADRIGYGMGKKDFEQANCVRAFLGETAEPAFRVAKLECNLDDMTGEEIGFALERLMDAGAHDAYTMPIGMKKSRPGVMLTCICREEDADRMAGLIMKHTTTLGIRRMDLNRYVLNREIRTQETSFGSVRLKQAEGMGVTKAKLEYEDLARIAREKGMSIAQVRTLIRKELSGKTDC